MSHTVATQNAQALDTLLGYLNFSSGAADAQILAGINQIFAGFGPAAARIGGPPQRDWRPAAAQDRGALGSSPARGAQRAGPTAAPAKAGGPPRSGGRGRSRRRASGDAPAASSATQDANGRGKDANLSPPVYVQVRDLLTARLKELHDQKSAFANASQAERVLELTWDHVLPEYRRFHSDLLFHHSDESLFQPLFIGRAIEAALARLPDLEDAAKVTQTALAQLNDYRGYRPVATLESQQIEPYPHESLRPIPLFVKGAGAAVGKYQKVVELALGILEETSPRILREAHFDLDQLEELAIDPRAYDFDHPANKRPNYHFGQWDPSHINRQGYYARYVAQQVTLEALMSRLSEEKKLPPDELLWEAAAVFAGTILMATGVSGAGPGAHPSTVTLSNLLPHIASYRDRFYEELIQRLGGKHAARLTVEAERLKQPFGAARQHLNAELARRRAEQLDHVHLARVFARMGYREAAERHADVAPAVSARMLCQLDCNLTAGMQAIDRGELSQASVLVTVITDQLKRGIQCGAIVDPWNILGFDGQYSLFPAIENSVHDHRVDELIHLMDRIFALMARLWSEAVARSENDLRDSTQREFEALANWWRQFAAHEVASVEATDAFETLESAQLVARALGLWRQSGAACGDVAFWAEHVEMFDSPQAYALVIEALLERGDLVASMALLISWLERAEAIGLERRDAAFHKLSIAWMRKVWSTGAPEKRSKKTAAATADEKSAPAPHDPWKLSCKFFDFLEANAGVFWRTPHFDLADFAGAGDDLDDLLVDDDIDDLMGEDYGDEGDALSLGESFSAFADDNDEDGNGGGLFDAAYEQMVFRDSADDGMEGDVFDDGYDTYGEDELQWKSRHIAERLAFHGCLARLWSIAAGAAIERSVGAGASDVFQRFSALAAQRQQELLELVDQTHSFKLRIHSSDYEALLEYDRQRTLKEMLVERILLTAVEMADAHRMITAAAAATADGQAGASPARLIEQVEESHPSPQEWKACIATTAALLRGDTRACRRQFNAYLDSLMNLPLLYIPLHKGGEPRRIFSVRVRQRAIRDLVSWLPRVGLFTETRRLVEAARQMEIDQPVGPGAVTEFDDIFDAGYRSMVHGLVSAVKGRRGPGKRKGKGRSAAALPPLLERLTQSLLLTWLAHSRSLRLSVLERVKDNRRWKKVVEFIRAYGGDLFSQHFLNLGNLRAILHRGVGNWLDDLSEEGPEPPMALFDDLDNVITRSDTIDCLTFILEAVVENYNEYRDYNSTTTQSDRGEMLYSLLDFLRLQAHYDRVAWNLRPVTLAHEILVREGETEAARAWRRALAERIGEEADKFERRLKNLQTKYAMRMPSVADRIGERFVRPMKIDRARALVEPAIKAAGQTDPGASFEMLEYEANALSCETTGSGFDVPVWLEALEDEVERVLGGGDELAEQAPLDDFVPAMPLDLALVEAEIDSWEE